MVYAVTAATALGSNSKMTVISPDTTGNWVRSGSETIKVRILTVDWQTPDRANERLLIHRQPLAALQNPQAASLPAADCLLLPADQLAAISPRAQAIIGLPVIVALPGRDDTSAIADVLDRADSFVFADDSLDTRLAVIAAACRHPGQSEVREIGNGTAQTIHALSADAGRIAEALARLAAQPPAAPDEVAIDAALVRRILKLRRERTRFLPDEIFADPAWDMLLDLVAARLEDKQVPVSSLCIAAAVPTTTALRWIRSLSEAGLLERSTDPRDARRTWIGLTPRAADAMLAWLRLFASQFAPRG